MLASKLLKLKLLSPMRTRQIGESIRMDGIQYKNIVNKGTPRRLRFFFVLGSHHSLQQIPLFSNKYIPKYPNSILFTPCDLRSLRKTQTYKTIETHLVSIFIFHHLSLPLVKPALAAHLFCSEAEEVDEEKMEKLENMSGDSLLELKDSVDPVAVASISAIVCAVLIVAGILLILLGGLFCKFGVWLSNKKSVTAEDMCRKQHKVDTCYSAINQVGCVLIVGGFIVT